MNIWRFLHINARYGVSRFRNNRLIGPFWLCFDSRLVKTPPEVVSRCRRQNWEPVWGPKLLLDKAQIEMKWSGDNASAVLTRRRSAEQEGYSMRPEWWIMHQFPDQRKQRARSICSVSPSLSNERRRWRHSRARSWCMLLLTLGRVKGHGEAVKSCDCTLQTAPFRVNPQHTTTWADTRSTLQEILGKLWEDSLFKKQEVVNSCVKPERTSLIVNLRKTLTRGNRSLRYATLELKWEMRFRWDKSPFLSDWHGRHQAIKLF